MDRSRIDQLEQAKGSQQDAARPDIVKRVGSAGRLTARERITRLLDADSGVEFGAIAAATRSGEWIPEAGGIDYIGTVNGTTVVTSSTDYTDHGGGYGAARLGRMFGMAKEYGWSVVIFVDGGGSRARHPRVGLNHVEISGQRGRFTIIDGMAELSGTVPTVAIVSGPAFAGHASLAGFSDCLIATRGSAIGMGGPPMVEAALGKRLTAHELAGAEMHEKSGGIDLLVDDEEAAIAAAKSYLSYLEPADPLEPVTTGDLAAIVPDVGPYDIRPVIEAIIDTDSLFELRPAFAPGLITGLTRLGGRTVGLMANQPAIADGAIDEACATKANRFIELCNAYGYPIVSLIDSMGTGRPNRWHTRPFMSHQRRVVPLMAVQLRHARGIASAIMAGFASGSGLPALYAGWPGAETGHRDSFSALIDQNAFDDIIHPDETRTRLVRMLRYLPDFSRPPGSPKRHPIDTW